MIWFVLFGVPAWRWGNHLEKKNSNAGLKVILLFFSGMIAIMIGWGIGDRLPYRYDLAESSPLTGISFTGDNGGPYYIRETYRGETGSSFGYYRQNAEPFGVEEYVGQADTEVLDNATTLPPQLLTYKSLPQRRFVWVFAIPITKWKYSFVIPEGSILNPR